MADTSAEFDSIINQCLSLFEKKSYDYGTAWRILRLPSLTDQIFIKAQRIRSLQTLSERKVEEGEVSEFIGIINYCIMALIQIDLGIVEQPDLMDTEAIELYDEKVALTKELMENKNHDYAFKGKSPAERMTDGGMNDLYAVREYLNGMRGAH